MKGAKGEGEQGALFPRLHVKEAEKNKGGPRAPPRNKMALYEQFTIPSHQFLPPSDHQAQLPHQHSRRAREIVRLWNQLCFVEADFVRNDRRYAYHPYNLPSTAALNTGGIFFHHGSSVGGSAEDESQTFTKPVSGGTRIPVPSPAPPTGGAQKAEKTKGIERSWVPHAFPSQGPETPSLNNNCIQQLRRSSTSDGTMSLAVTNSLPPRMQNQYKALSNSRINAETMLQSSIEMRNKGVTSSVQDNSAVEKEELVDFTDEASGLNPRKQQNSIMRNRDYTGDSENLSNKDSRASESSLLEEISDNDSDSSMLDSISLPKVVSKDVVKSFGYKQYWKARKTIIKQQKVFSDQVFELHKLIKVQQLIAAAPSVLGEGELLNESPATTSDFVTSTPEKALEEPRKDYPAGTYSSWFGTQPLNYMGGGGSYLPSGAGGSVWGYPYPTPGLNQWAGAYPPYPFGGGFGSFMVPAPPPDVGSSLAAPHQAGPSIATTTTRPSSFLSIPSSGSNSIDGDGDWTKGWDLGGAYHRFSETDESTHLMERELKRLKQVEAEKEAEKEADLQQQGYEEDNTNSALNLFPLGPTSDPEESENARHAHINVIKAVPRSAINASKSTAGILRSLQQERRP